MSDKPQQGSGYRSDDNRQSQQSGSTQHASDRFGNAQTGDAQTGSTQQGRDNAQQGREHQDREHQDRERESGEGGKEGGPLRPALQRARHAIEEGVERQAQNLQERARNTGEQISDAIGAAARRLDHDESWLAGPAQDLAQSVQRLTARGLGSPAEMKERVVDFARRHPAWALAGAVAVGFAAVRFLKATGSGGGSASSGEHHRFTDRDESDAQQAGLAERPDAVQGAARGTEQRERFHG